MSILIVGFPFAGRGGVETIVPIVAQHLQQSGQLHGFLFFEQKRNPCKDWGWLSKFPLTKVQSNLPKAFSQFYFAIKLKKYLSKNSGITHIICLNPQTCFIASLATHRSQKYLITSWIHNSLHDISSRNQKRLLCAHQHWAISKGISQQLKNLGIADENIHLIYNGINRQQKSLFSQSPALKLLNIGRIQLQNQKSLATLFEGLSLLKIDWELHIVGSGTSEEEEKCRSYIQTLHIEDKVHFHGWQKSPWTYVENQIGPVSAYVASSSFEGFPMTLIEAMSYGLPCIFTDCPTGPSEVIQNGQNGFLYPVHDAKALATTLENFATTGVHCNSNTIKQTITPFYLDKFLQRIDDIIHKNVHSSQIFR